MVNLFSFSYFLIKWEIAAINLMNDVTNVTMNNSTSSFFQLVNDSLAREFTDKNSTTLNKKKQQ